jgi:hypothetical protein
MKINVLEITFNILFISHFSQESHPLSSANTQFGLCHRESFGSFVNFGEQSGSCFGVTSAVC